MPTIGILPIEYMGIKEILGITYRKKNAYNTKSEQMKVAVKKKFFFPNLVY